MQRFLRLALAVSSAIVACLALPMVGAAQGVTTGGVAGTVTDSAGSPIAGATVRVSNPATGFLRIATTRVNGRYVLSGLEVGTYRVAVAVIGYGPKALAGVPVALSQTARADFTMARQAVTLQEIVTTAPATSADFAPTRTGAQTFISDSAVQRLPTLNRQLQDFVRLTPQVVTNPAPASAGEVSIAGQNYRFNAIQVDGTAQNDKFGLSDTGELGGQAGGRGISLEAVKSYQVVVSPYNVTQGGFTGGLINAVTKNGTNRLAVTGFYTIRNQDLTPNVPLFAPPTTFLRRQFGGSVGGPIIKDKLHFFLAGELQKAIVPATGPYLGQSADVSSQLRVDDALINRFVTALEKYGLVGGTGTKIENLNPSTNLVGRLDWTLSPKHRLVLRGIYDNSHGDDFSRSSSFFTLSSNKLVRNEKASSVTAQFFSNFAGGASNEFQVGMIRQRFDRASAVKEPQITIDLVPSPVVTGSTVTLRAGTDSSSHLNQLDQDVLELRNDFTFPLGNGHLVTLGARAETYKIRNLFWGNAFGSWRFASLDALEAGTPTAYGVEVAVGADPTARFKTANMSFYLQDQWRVNPDLTVTYGIRAELPHFFDKPPVQEAAFRDFGRNTDEIPANMNINPRLGFNLTPGGGSGSTQIRGGVGLFSGTPSYVWLSNMFTNNGKNGTAGWTCAQAVVPAFNSTTATVAGAPQVCSNGQGPGIGTNIGVINTVDPKYRQPQVLRATFGVDRKLPMGITGTVDAVYTYALKSPFMANLALADPTTSDANGRVMYGTLAATTGLPTTARKTPDVYSGGVYDLRNAKGDYSYGVTAGLAKRFAGSLEASAFYSYQRSYSVQDFTSSRAVSNFNNGRVNSGNQYDQQVGRSTFDRPNRVTASVSYTAPWKNYPTDVSFIYLGQSGTNFTYTYAGSSSRGDVNADGVSSNDPIYIPTSSAEMSFVANGAFTPAMMRLAWDSLLDKLPCMASQRGQIMARGTCSNPWFNQLDFSVRQSMPAIGGHKLTIQADIYNFLNFLNSGWGQYRQNNRFPQVTLLTVTGKNADGRPNVQMDTRMGGRDFIFPKVLNAAAYWQGQVTMRYAF